LKKPIRYKYINLLLRFIIGVVAVWFIYKKLNTNFIDNLNQIDITDLNWSLILLTISLLFVNWGMEAIKWRFAIRGIEKITISKAFKLTLTGITIGLLTPNRIGEIPARALLLNKGLFKEIALKTTVSSFSQVIITFLLGGLGLILTQKYFKLGLDSLFLNAIVLISLMVLLTLYFRVNKLTPIFKKIRILKNQELVNALLDFQFIELFTLLIFSFLRYIVFFLQYWLILQAFGVELNSVGEILLIPVCFLFASSIPTILISEIGVRGSVALFVFGVVSDMEIQIVLASITLWLINVAIPVLIGLFNLKELKLLKEK